MAKQKHLAMLVALFILALLFPASSGTEKCKIDGDSGKAPPYFNEVLSHSYTITLEMTDIIKNETYYIEEVHERKVDRDGKLVDTAGLRIVRNDTEEIYQYYPENDVLVREFNGVCAEMETHPGFWWGWVDHDSDHGSRNIGPSNILRLSKFLKTRLTVEPQEPDEGVEIEEWVACGDESTEIRYHYNKAQWSMPESSVIEGTNGMVAIEIQVNFMDGTGNWLYAITDMWPTVKVRELLEPPRGLGCEGMTGILTDESVPVIPKHFSFAAEEVLNSLIDGMDFGNQHLDKTQLTYAGEMSLISYMVSLPYDNKYGTSYAVKVIQDFNTGVEYKIFKEFGNCSEDFIPPFSFDVHFGAFMGNGATLLSPNGLFHLDDKFAYVGEHGTRDISGDLWTSTRRGDIPDPTTGGMQTYMKAVLEYYFAMGAEKKPSGQFIQTNLPLRSDLFVYNKSNEHQIVYTLTSNYYDFRVLDIFSSDEFSVEECYEKHDDKWSYMDIFFPVIEPEQFEAASEEQRRFKHEVMAKMVEIGRLSPVRIATIDVATGISGIFPNSTDVDMIVATIKLLERAPYIYSYRKPPGETMIKPGDKETLIKDLTRIEDCARQCYTTTDLDCKGFHHCGTDCYLSKTTGIDGTALESVEHCEHWVFDLQNRTVEDHPSDMVYKSVFGAIRHGDFTFNVKYRNDTVAATYEAKMTLHYRTPDIMDPLRRQFTLEDKYKTVAHPNDTIKVFSLTECMVLCVTRTRYRCETLVYQGQEGLCLLLSVHYDDLDPSELVHKRDSFVHGRSYLMEYSPILGGVALNTSGPSYNQVEHLEKCAKLCSTETKIECQSFEWCPSNQLCHLHAEHYLDVVENGNYITGTSCIHFSSNKKESIFSKYEDQGLAPSQHKLAAVLTSSSACAKMCVEDENEVCQSYDFCSKCNEDNLAVCGDENDKGIGLCFLATHHLGESDLKLTTAKGCDHYDRDQFWGKDYANWVSSQQESNPYTPGDMAGLAFGMIFLGMIVAVAFLVGMSYCRPASVPKDFELSFMKLKTSGESSI